VFVSHNMQAVGELCDEALVIQGAPRFRGAVGEAVGCYLALANGGAQRDVGDGVAARALRLTDAAGRVVDAAAPHTALQLHAELELTRDFPQPPSASSSAAPPTPSGLRQRASHRGAEPGSRSRRGRRSDLRSTTWPTSHAASTLRADVWEHIGDAAAPVISRPPRPHRREPVVAPSPTRGARTATPL
jgi:hypothetical protein